MFGPASSRASLAPTVDCVRPVGARLAREGALADNTNLRQQKRPVSRDTGLFRKREKSIT
ncbi:hypothetical protein EMIT0P44_10230 [Pseudomonas sp. IT-P44]